MFEPEWIEDQDVFSRKPPETARFRWTWPLWWVAGIVLYRWRMWWRKTGIFRHEKPGAWWPGRIYNAVKRWTEFRRDRAPIHQPVRLWLRRCTVDCVNHPIIGCDSCGHNIDDTEAQFDVIDAGPSYSPDDEPWAYGWLWCDRCGRRNWFNE